VSVSSAAEDYLKTIWALQTRGDPVTTGGVAAQLGVSSPSVSGMLKRLHTDGLVVRHASGDIGLTEQGQRHALRVVRRHRLLETFLAQVLHMSWDEVHDEAELLEHAVSDRLEARIDAVLGHPARDPHGDPIPPQDGDHEERWAQPLAGAKLGAGFVVERVSDRDSAALRYLAELGIGPGVRLLVEERAPFGGPLWVRIGDRREAIGPQLACIVHGTEVA
jgi:DtxR family transcriptional regulator, Mn-dependent transcriptional regulator